jgi:hypothetical protein
VGEITEISGDLKALSHQLAVFTHPPTVVSHDLLMHQNLDRFLRQPRDIAIVALRTVQPGTALSLSRQAVAKSC